MGAMKKPGPEDVGMNRLPRRSTLRTEGSKQGHFSGHRTNIPGDESSMGKGPDVGRGKDPWKDHGDRSSEGRGKHEMRLAARGQIVGEGRRCLKAMLRLSWSLFLRIGYLLRVLNQGRPGGLLPTLTLGLWTWRTSVC